MLRHQVLRQADVVQQRARRADGGFVFLAVQTEAVQVLAAEVFGQQLRARVGGKLPRVQARNVGGGRLKTIRQVFAFGQQDFRRLQTRQLVGEFVRRRQLGFEFAALQRSPRDGDVFFIRVHRRDAVGFLVFQKRRVGQRAGRNDAHDFALHRPFARADFAHLLAHRHAFAHLHQPRQILLRRVKRHTRHLNRHAVHLPARGQGDVQQLRRFHRIIQKQLVKIAHAVKHQLVGVLRFDGEILLHHRGNGGLGHNEAYKFRKQHYCSKRRCFRRHVNNRNFVDKFVEIKREILSLSTKKEII